MTLTLELTASSAARPGDALQRSFDEQGGTIGRASTNSWVLTHNKVSGHHAVISFRNGVFYIEDTSRNGVAVNSMDNRLVQNRPYALKTGDRIFIEPYEIGVWIQGQPAAAPPSRFDPFAEADPFAAPGSGWPIAAASPEVPAQGDVVDPLILIPGEAPKRTAAPPPPPTDDLLAQHYQPPAVVPTAPSEPPAATPAIPAGYNPLDDAFPESSAPAARPQPSRAYVSPVPSPTPSPAPSRSVATPPSVAPPAPVSPARSGGPAPRVPDDPFAERPAAASEGPPSGPIAVAPLDLDALTGPPPAEAPPVAPIRPRPGMDSQARRRPKDLLIEDPQTLRFPDAAGGSSAAIPRAATPVPNPPPAAAAEPLAAPASSAPPSAPAAVPSAAAPAAAGDLGALLAGAGLPGAAVTPELSRDIGRILRVVVEGLMDVLQSRQRIKEEFGMQQTVFRPSENNPLKFSANLEDALHNLFVKRNPAYLGSVEAFADAFDDLRDHQLAVLAGLRVAFDATLAQFDPDRLQERFEGQAGKGALPLVPAKMRYWDMFRTMRADLTKDPEAAFERLFGEEFRRAYEEQFRKLKAQRRARARS